MGIYGGPNILDNIITDGLVLYMDAANNKIYTGGTNITDPSNGFTGTLVNGASFTNTNGGEFDLDGVDDYIDFNNILNSVFTGTSFTIETWSKRDDSSGNQTIWGKWTTTGNQRMVLFRQTTPATNDRIQLDITSAGTGASGEFIYSSTPYVHGLWDNFTFIWDNSQASPNDEVKIYRNGVRAILDTGSTTLDGNDTIFSGSGQFRVGWSENQDRFDGKIPIIKAYDRNLSSTEVLQNFDALKSRFL